MNEKELMKKKYGTPQEISVIFGVSVGQLANLRYRQRGCPHFRRGRRIYYEISTFQSWLTENPVKTIYFE